MKMILLHLERGIVVVLATIALFLAIVSFRGLVPLTDPLTPIGYMDKLSLFFGLHEQSHVMIVEPHQWSTDIHLFTFQRRLKDGGFFLASQKTESLASVALLDTVTPQATEAKCAEIIRSCNNLSPFSVTKQNIPILVGLPPLDDLSKDEQRILVSGLDTCLSNSEFEYNREGSLGTINSSRQLLMQWFALALLNGKLPNHKPQDTPVIVEANDQDLEMTFAISSLTRLSSQQKNGNASIKLNEKVSVFGDTWDVVTIRIPGLGLLKSRQMILAAAAAKNKKDKHLAASPCVNPVVDRWWEYGGVNYHVKGISKAVEEVKERNGPFAGKKIQRPIANYEECHHTVVSYVNQVLGKNYDQIIKDLKRRKVYVRGKLFIQCTERGLTDPFKGGNVRLRAYMDSLKHACKVPNTDQPFACVDMMITGVLFDKILGLHKGSVLHTTQKINGFAGDWPVTAALQVYQNGL